VVAVAVYSGVNVWQDTQHAKALNELGAILVMDDGAERTGKLKAFAASGPADLRPAAQLELAAVTMEAGAYDDAVAAWQSLGQKDGMRAVAGLGEARALMHKGDHAAAVEVLKALKQDAGEEFAAPISSALAFAAEKAGQTELAIAEYETMKSLAGGNAAFLDYKINKLKAKTQG
jgi:cytochrome c-type biogenesis protein CcmH/NrfG